MTKKNIKAITSSDFHKISELLNSDKEYLTVCNLAPPKKDDGQLGLQIVFKTENFGIANLIGVMYIYCCM